jgi:hypothetical protein
MRERIAEVYEVVEPFQIFGEIVLKFLGQLIVDPRFAEAHVFALKLGAIAIRDVLLIDPMSRQPNAFIVKA